MPTRQRSFMQLSMEPDCRITDVRVQFTMPGAASRRTPTRPGRIREGPSVLIGRSRLGSTGFSVVGPKRPLGSCAVDFSGRKTGNRTSIILPRWFIADGRTGWIP
jgi:hypothetical protein